MFKTVSPEYTGSNLIVASFYRFFPVDDVSALSNSLSALFEKYDVKGTIILSSEGLNGALSFPFSSAKSLYTEIHSLTNQVLEYKENFCNTHPFQKLKIKIKPEIVTMRSECNLSPGIYVPPNEWDDFISRHDVLLIDTRNDYEYQIGTFKGAVNPDIDSFRDFPSWLSDFVSGQKDKKIAMFCTGGIRCEKSTSYAKDIGLNDVYHLEGGIIKYLIQTKNANQMWVGDCFVFDDRLIVNDKLESLT